MTAFVIAGIGILGTLTAAITTQVLAAREAERQRAAHRAVHVQDLRRDAMAGFAEALMSYRRAQIEAWHLADRHAQKHDETDVSPDARNQRARAWAAFHRVQLLWPEESVVESCRALLAAASDLKNGDDPKAHARAGDRVRNDVSALMAKARGLLSVEGLT